ncbi:MAG TPA: TonB-dependent receptor, partial [Bacteroidales bacterium]|nr:TonB-dependent receptor [Bacteroidales bacterium]
MKKLAVLFLLTGVMLMLFSWQALSQQVSITVKDTKRQPLPGATVELKNLKDSVSVFTTTNLDGVAIFKGIFNGLYILRISYIGFESLEKTISVKPDGRDFDFRLEENSIALEEVTITAKKPMITQEDDKMIIDPEPMANSSTNTMEVLESTPGLYVDQDGGIFINGAAPAAIYINGREQKMSTQDITAILRNLPPGSVQRIEVLRTPSTKFDAASSGGIVNVVLKKGVKLGRHGSVNTGMNQGSLGNYFGGFSLNNSDERSSYYLNINYNHNGRFDELNAARRLEGTGFLFQTTESERFGESLYAGYGINYDPRDNINLSYDGRINYSWNYSSSENINFINSTENDTLSKSTNLADYHSTPFSISQDFGMVVKFDTLGSELDTKLSYSYNRSKSLQEFSYIYSLPTLVELEGENDNLQGRHFVVFQSDLTWKLPYKFSLETGVKSGIQFFGSDAGYYLFQDGIRVGIPQRASAFTYTENINAAYLQLSKTLWKKFIIKSGVRMEHTFMDGHQTQPSDTGFVINRADWFPYVYLSRKVFEVKGFELFAYLIYRRTISRPDYQNLNPTINYDDEYMFETGNPALKPQFTDNFEMNFSYNDMPLFAIGRNYTHDIFSQVVYQHPDYEDVLVRTYDNLGKNTETYFRGIAGLPPGGIYYFGVGAQYDLNEYDGYYQGEPLQFTRGSWRFFTFHSLTLFKETKIRVSGFMMVNGNWNFYELGTFGQLNISITQTLLNKKLSISLSARDVLRTMETHFELNQPGVYSYGSRYTDNQRFGINIRYNFGISSKKDKNDMLKMNGEE